MAKNITTNARTDNSVALLHLFQIDFQNLDGTPADTFYFTDHDIIVNDGVNTYLPMAVNFDSVTETNDNKVNSITLSVENIQTAFFNLSQIAINYEWRRNPFSIKRVMYIPDIETVDGVEYEFGYGNSLTGEYPELNISTITNKDVYNLFDGYVDTFSANEETIQVVLSTKFLHWKNTFPPKTYDQKIYTSIIDAISDELYWGKKKP